VIDDAEKTALPERLEISSEIIKSFATAGLELTMTSFNGNKKRKHTCVSSFLQLKFFCFLINNLLTCLASPS
jgi:hypothetical protein